MQLPERIGALHMLKRSQQLSRAITTCARLPNGDQLRIAAAYRFECICHRFYDSTPRIAEYLYVSHREVQRLRVLYGVARPADGHK